MSKDFSQSIEDVRAQFKYTIDMNKDMSFQKLNPPIFQNQEYEQNMQNFKRMLKEDIFGKNIKVYMNQLIKTKTTVNVIQNLGFFRLTRWRSKFSPSFKLFKNHKDLKIFTNSAYERVDSFIKSTALKEVGPVGDLYRKNNKAS